ncbi:MAG: F0F1 ATP synthase subunit epsilon, partial [Alphaproteobacteria bacterium]|nr:F0F1 ATP synthase subunit epsilon [Alphaproteobacteria bacterium]
HAPLITGLRAGMIDVLKDGTDTRFFIRGGFAEVSAQKVTVLAEEALPMSELALPVLDQRVRDAEEELAAAQTDEERHDAAERLDDLKMVRAAF